MESQSRLIFESPTASSDSKGSISTESSPILQCKSQAEGLSSRRLGPKKVEVLKSLDQKKLSPNLEGPYRVIEILRSGAYWLETLDRTTIPQT